MSSELENKKETIETLNGIMNSMEKEILENQVDFMIKHDEIDCIRFSNKTML